MEKGKVETKSLKEICGEAKVKGQLSEDQLAILKSVFGQRFINAWEAVEDARVKRYVFKPSDRTVWVVVGKERDYLIMAQAEFCTCDDFYFRVMEREVHMCYHLIAQKLANALSWFEGIEEHDELYDSLMSEWKKATV